MKLGTGTPLQQRVHEAREKEWNNTPTRHTFAQALQLHSARINATDPSDTDALIRNIQAMKEFLRNAENKIQSGQAQ